MVAPDDIVDTIAEGRFAISFTLAHGVAGENGGCRSGVACMLTFLTSDDAPAADLLTIDVAFTTGVAADNAAHDLRVYPCPKYGRDIGTQYGRTKQINVCRANDHFCKQTTCAPTYRHAPLDNAQT